MDTLLPPEQQQMTPANIPNEAQAGYRYVHEKISNMARDLNRQKKQIPNDPKISELARLRNIREEVTKGDTLGLAAYLSAESSSVQAKIDSLKGRLALQYSDDPLYENLRIAILRTGGYKSNLADSGMTGPVRQFIGEQIRAARVDMSALANSGNNKAKAFIEMGTLRQQENNLHRMIQGNDPNSRAEALAYLQAKADELLKNKSHNAGRLDKPRNVENDPEVTALRNTITELNAGQPEKAIDYLNNELQTIQGRIQANETLINIPDTGVNDTKFRMLHEQISQGGALVRARNPLSTLAANWLENQKIYLSREQAHTLRGKDEVAVEHLDTERQTIENALQPLNMRAPVIGNA